MPLLPKNEIPELESKTRFGARVEELAEARLRAQGWTILARNFRLRSGELDIVAEEPVGVGSGKNELVFVEVRARCSPGSWVNGVESVRPGKRIRLERAA